MKTKQPEVTIYSTPTCHYCGVAKKMFDENNIKYTVIDVAKDVEKRKEMVAATGQMGVPVILVGDKTFVGFSDEARASICKQLGI
jgi:glutaredoxin